MESFTIWFDRNLFSDDVVMRAAHRYTNFFHVDLRSTSDRIGVSLTPRDGVEPPADIGLRLRGDALDERLRQIVRQETQDLHLELVRAALRESRPRSGEGTP